MVWRVESWRMPELSKRSRGTCWLLESQGLPSSVERDTNWWTRPPLWRFPSLFVPRGVCLGEIYGSKLLASSLILKNVYFPRNRVAAFNRHRCPKLRLEDCLVSSHTISELKDNYLFHHWEQVAPLTSHFTPCHVDGGSNPREEAWARGITFLATWSILLG